ncbi:MAG: acyl-ACP--UDP-N-acetylglucosamine O-acyltransferase [Spirosomataceae bacterium]
MTQPLSYIHPDAQIGEDVVVSPFSYIAADVKIGSGTWIGPNVTIFDGARIGANCKIFPGAVIAAEPQDLKFNGEYTTVEIGDRTTIRECVTINRGTVDQYTTKIGSDALIMAYCHIAHDCLLGDHVIMANSVQMAGHVELGDYAFIGGTSAVHQFVKIGAHAMIAGGSLVRKDVPPFVKAAREPLSYAGVNSLGLRRRGFTSEEIYSIQDVYRYIYLRDLNTSDALQAIVAELPQNEYVKSAVQFIENSKRGIIRKGSGPISDD